MGQTDNSSVAFYCMNCGAALEQGARFCSRCGTQVVGKPEKPAEKEKSKSPVLLGIVALVVIAFVVGLAAGGEGTQSENNQADSMESVTVSAADYLEQAEAYMAEGNYYEAMNAIDACWTEYPDSNQAEECNELAAQIEEKLSFLEPENGETLERTFKYQGSCVLRAAAQNGSAEITVRDKEKPEEFVRFYVREGETAEINLVGGIYVIEYKIGYIWFNDEIGFGDFCYEDKFDEDFNFEVSVDNAWISSAVWEITV